MATRLENEKVRIYTFKHESLIINKPLSLTVHEDGVHVVADSGSRVYYIKPGWLYCTAQEK